MKYVYMKFGVDRLSFNTKYDFNLEVLWIYQYMLSSNKVWFIFVKFDEDRIGLVLIKFDLNKWSSVKVSWDWYKFDLIWLVLNYGWFR